MFEKDKLARRIGVYVSVGVLSFLVEYSSFLLLFNTIGGSPHALIISQSVSFLLGLVTSFTGSRLFTFNNKNKDYSLSVTKQIYNYLTLALINFALSNGVMYIMVYGLSVTPVIAKLLMMLLVVSWNFLIFDKYIFKSTKSTHR